VILENQLESLIPQEAHDAIVYNIGNTNTSVKIDLSNERIDKKFVHKNRVENVLIAHPIVLSEEKKIYRTKIIADLNHTFFFDHSLGHLPGMLLLEAARQFGTTISHLYFNAPFDAQFILHDLSSRFTAGVNSVDDAFIDILITDIKMKNDKLRKMSGIGYVHQNGQVVGKIGSSWSIIPGRVLEHLTKFH